MDEWPAKVHGYAVTKKPLGEGTQIKSPVVGVLHTTEGNTAENAWTFLKGQGYCPHFIIDGDAILQCRSLRETSSTLRHSDSAPYSPNSYAIQIEIAAFSQQDPWQLASATFERVAAVMAYASAFHEIPLVVPNDWPDDCHDMPGPWAAENSRRKWAKVATDAGLHRYPSVRGWWEHMEVPWQDPTWHWDAGALRRSELIAKAEALVGSQLPDGAVTPEPPAWPGRQMRLSAPIMSGDDVRDWQSEMARRGTGILIDGRFGPQTDTVTRAFQTSHKLQVDGIVGPITWSEAFDR